MQFFQQNKKSFVYAFFMHFRLNFQLGLCACDALWKRVLKADFRQATGMGSRRDVPRRLTWAVFKNATLTISSRKWPA